MRHVLIGLGGCLFPGLGHGIAGRKTMTIGWMSGPIVAHALTFLSVWMFYAGMLVHLAAGIDGAIRARQSGRAGIRPDTTFALLAVGVAIVGALTVRMYSVEMFKIPSSSMYPTLQIGDHVLVDKLSPRWRSPERGEVIVFWQPCQPDRAYIKRVIAVAGDTIEVRCNVVYLDGKAVPATLVAADCSYKDHDEMDGRWFERECSRYRETLGGTTYDVFHDRDRPQRDAQRKTAPLADGDQRDFPMDGLLRTCGNQSDFASQPSKSQRQGKLVETVGRPVDPCQPRQHFVVPEDSLFVMGDHRNNANDSRYWGVVPLDNVIGRAIGIWWPLSRARGLD